MEPDLSLAQTLEKLGIALGLGLLIGMQRERTDSRLAGFRTFPLTTMFGTVAGLLALRFGGLVVAAGFASLAALLIFDTFTMAQTTQDNCVTNAVTIFLLFCVRGLLVSRY